MKYLFLFLSFLLIISCSSQKDEVQALKEQMEEMKKTQEAESKKAAQQIEEANQKVVEVQNKIEEESNKSPEEKAADEKLKEMKSVRKYLKVKSLDTEGKAFANDDIVLVLENTSNHLTYKNIPVKVNYLAKTGAIIKSFNKTIFDFLPPKAIKKFKFRMQDYPSEMKSYNVEFGKLEVE